MNLPAIFIKQKAGFCVKEYAAEENAVKDNSPLAIDRLPLAAYNLNILTNRDEQ